MRIDFVTIFPRMFDPLLAEGGALAHAEAVLLVDNGDGQALEGDPLLH